MHVSMSASIKLMDLSTWIFLDLLILYLSLWKISVIEKKIVYNIYMLISF